MTERGLNIDYTYLRNKVGHYLGKDRDHSTWDERDTQDVDDVIDSGLRQFYYPENGHDWSFLAPTYEMKIESDVGDYDLPDEFSEIAGSMHYSSTDEAWHSIDITNASRIYALREQNITAGSGRPELAAVEPRGHLGDAKQGYRLLVWPDPNGTYSLRFPMKVIPLALSKDRPHPWGGGAFSECILTSCLAVAGARINDEQNVHAVDFQRMLASAVASDARVTGTHFFGYNSDRSDAVHRDRRWLLPVTYNDQAWGD